EERDERSEVAEAAGGEDAGGDRDEDEVARTRQRLAGCDQSLVAARGAQRRGPSEAAGSGPVGARRGRVGGVGRDRRHSGTGAGTSDRWESRSPWPPPVRTKPSSSVTARARRRSCSTALADGGGPASTASMPDAIADAEAATPTAGCPSRAATASSFGSWATARKGV